ncbi:hypothetical protein [Pseudolysinimonas sp.]
MTLTTGTRPLGDESDVVDQIPVHDATWALPPDDTDPRVIA